MEDKYRVFIRGVEGRGKEVIKRLEDLGGKVPPLDIGGDPSYIYYITHDGDIGCVLYESEVGKIIMDNYTELHLPEKWKDGDILFSEADDDFAVFEEEYKIDSDKFLSYIATWHGEYLTYQVIHKRDYRLATKSEVAKFHELLHKRGKDWDSENKQLVDWQWKPEIHEYYFFVNSDLSVLSTSNDGPLIDLDAARIRRGNCFRTREEAVAAAKRVKKALKGGEK